MFVRCVEAPNADAAGVSTAPWHPIALPSLAWLAGAGPAPLRPAEAATATTSESREAADTPVASASSAASIIDAIAVLLKSIGKFIPATSPDDGDWAGTVWGCAIRIQIVARVLENQADGRDATTVAHEVTSSDPNYHHRDAVVSLVSAALSRWFRCACSAEGVPSVVALHLSPLPPTAAPSSS
jgi:hypothetical protein